MLSELKRLIEQMCKDRGLDRTIIIEALEAAMLNAARKKMGPQVEIEAHYNEEAGEIEVFQFKRVEERVTDPDMEISLAEAREMDEEVELGDSLGMKVDTSTLAGLPSRPPSRSSSSASRMRNGTTFTRNSRTASCSSSTVLSRGLKGAASSSIWAGRRV